MENFSELVPGVLDACFISSAAALPARVWARASQCVQGAVTHSCQDLMLWHAVHMPPMHMRCHVLRTGLTREGEAEICWPGR
jgi:hypothetical protein